ncbi:YY1 associated factor 2 [Phyllostomus discolor]|uniref:YY1 associated factor 2 n=4 Tax=Phyllostomidae TaxID=9415 RepID=A0A834AXQ8_9CHIR|nr:YY1 associated factor 2 [Phyllostomus discolor]
MKNDSSSRGCSVTPTPPACQRTRCGCWAALAAFEVSGAAADWRVQITCAEAGVSPTAGGCVGSGGGSELSGAAFPAPSLPPPPPVSARLIILLIDKQRPRQRLSACICSQAMGDKKSPTRPKRQPKPSSDEGYWDCSVCTFRNSAEAFKCMMCDVRKGTSTRKPRPVSQLVAQQVTQQFVPPTQSKKEKKDKVEKEKSEKETTSKKNSHKKTRPRLKNVDRSSAQHLEVTVGDLTVIITDFKEKTKSPPASSAASGDQHSQSGSSSDNTERGMSRSSSPRGEASSLNGESH